MTTLIPDSWEMPSYLAGDLVPMDKYRGRGVREVLPDADEDGDWDRDAEIRTHPSWAVRRGPSAPASPEPEKDWGAGLRTLENMEPYDPEKHGPMEPGDLTSQDSLDALDKAGFDPREPGVWHRPVMSETGEHLGPSHMIFYAPGHRRPSDNSRAPWHLTTDPEEVGTAHSSLRSAIKAADDDVAQIRKMPHQARLYLSMVRIAAARTPGQGAADDWLAQHSDESFEHDPRAEARDWMDQNAHQYEEWHPSTRDYTYSDFPDFAGGTFPENWENDPHRGGADRRSNDTDDAYERPPHRDDEPHPGEMQPHRQGWTPRDWEMFHYRGEDPPSSRHSDDDEDDAYSQDEQSLADHGFDWRANDPTAGSAENPYTSETPGHYYRYQHDPEGNHIATHTISQGPDHRWTLQSGPSDTQDFLTSNTSHRSASDAIDKFRQNAAEALLPQHGYEPHRGRTGWATHWTRTDPAPGSNNRHEDYEHEISFPEGGGFLGQTENGTLFPHGNFARNGNQAHHAHDLADVVREQSNMGRGLHPGGQQDFRLSRNDLMADPSVARLGEPSSISDNFWGDNKVGRASWHTPHPTDTEHPIHTEANYNWDKGGYDFKYTHDGVPLYPNHEHFPAGAPVHVPGRQLSLLGRS